MKIRKKHIPYILATITSLAVIILQFEHAIASEWLMLIASPFVIFLMVPYLTWAAVVRTAGTIASSMGLPYITGFWLVALLIIVLTISTPIILHIKKKKTPLLLQLIMGFFIPLIVLIPFTNRDEPEIEWHQEIVWEWKELESKQLNITLPWNAPLMRSNDGVNVGYAARTFEDGIEVLQETSTLIQIQADQIEVATNESNPEWNAELNFWREDLPEGFSCNGAALLPTEFSTIEIFGEKCELSYEGTEIANIQYGNLVDLDLHEESGLLAISINMGSYDPTYVYVINLPISKSP